MIILLKTIVMVVIIESVLSLFSQVSLLSSCIEFQPDLGFVLPRTVLLCHKGKAGGHTTTCQIFDVQINCISDLVAGYYYCLPFLNGFLERPSGSGAASTHTRLHNMHRGLVYFNVFSSLLCFCFYLCWYKWFIAVPIWSIYA